MHETLIELEARQLIAQRTAESRRPHETQIRRRHRRLRRLFL